MTNLKWLENSMTSNIAPSPYIVEVSGQYSNTYAGWKAFNGTNKNEEDCWSSNKNKGWISFYLGDKYKIGGIAIVSRVNSRTGEPKKFKVYVSDDNLEWKEALYKDNEISWASNEKREYYFENSLEGKFVKLDVFENNGRVRLDIGQIYIYAAPIEERAIIQNKENFYSLKDNALISLPNKSDKNMILHGIKAGKEIQLDVPFNKINYVNEGPTVNSKGKIFMQSISSANKISINEMSSDNNFEIIDIWYETKMTSNTTPSPLVASASSEYTTNSYLAWKAFNGTTIDEHDRWRSTATTNQHIQIDFGELISVNVVKITAVNYSTTVGGTPIEFEIHGSEDDSVWEKISDIVTDNFKVNEERIFFFNKVSYRYFKIVPIKNQNGVSFFNIGDIKFGYREKVK